MSESFSRGRLMSALVDLHAVGEYCSSPLAGEDLILGGLRNLVRKKELKEFVAKTLDWSESRRSPNKRNVSRAQSLIVEVENTGTVVVVEWQVDRQDGKSTGEWHFEWQGSGVESSGQCQSSG